MTRRLALLLPVVLAAVLLGGGRVGAQDATTTTADPAAATADEVQAIFAGPQFGDYPDSHYLYYTGDGSAKLTVPNVPGPLDDIAKSLGAVPSQVDTGVPTDRTASGWFADLGWSIGQTCATVVRSIVHWLYTFGFIRVLSPIVAYIAGILNGIAVGPLNLANVLWVVTGIALAFRLLFRRRFASFFADLGIALVLFVAAGMLMEKPAVIFDGVANLASEVAQMPLALIGGGPAEGDPAKGLTEAEQALKEVWTVAPWEITNFGHTLTGACADAGHAIAANGPYGKTSDAPRKVMLAAGCKAEASYNNESTPRRTAIVWGFDVAGMFVAAFILAMAFGFLRALVRLGRQLVVGGYAALIAMTPWTHDVAWDWLRDALHNLIAIIVPSWVLASMLVADVLVMRLPAIPVGFQTLILIAVNAGVFHQRRQLTSKVAAKLSGGVNRIHARTANVDAANLDAKRRAQEQSRGVHDLMPGSKLVTVPLVAGAVGVGRQVATGGKHVRTVRSAATKVAGPAGAAVKATKLGAAMTAKDAASGVTDAARGTAQAGRTAAAGVAGVAQSASAKTSSYAADYRAKRDARRGVGVAPLGERHGPHLSDVGPVHGPHLEDVDTLAPGADAGPTLAELAASEAQTAAEVGSAASKVA